MVNIWGVNGVLQLLLDGHQKGSQVDLFFLYIELFPNTFSVRIYCIF